jgi:hypothetical protein
LATVSLLAARAVNILYLVGAKSGVTPVAMTVKSGRAHTVTSRPSLGPIAVPVVRRLEQLPRCC